MQGMYMSIKVIMGFQVGERMKRTTVNELVPNQTARRNRARSAGKGTLKERSEKQANKLGAEEEAPGDPGK